jgi:hypothetical protein
VGATSVGGTSVGTTGAWVAGASVTTSVGVACVAQAARTMLSSMIPAINTYNLLCFIFLFSFSIFIKLFQFGKRFSVVFLTRSTSFPPSSRKINGVIRMPRLYNSFASQWR